MSKLQVELTREDWSALLGFLQAANDVRGLMQRVAKSGKQQISVNDGAVTKWLDTDVPSDVWLKLGALMSAGTSKEASNGQ
jgi:hypothetical protein